MTRVEVDQAVEEGLLDPLTDPSFQCQDPQAVYNGMKSKKLFGGQQGRDRIIRVCQDLRLPVEEINQTLYRWGY